MYRRVAVVAVAPRTEQGRACADGIVRGVVAAEIKSQNDKTRVELERAKVIETHRNRLLADHMANLSRSLYTHGPLQPLQDAWAMVAGCAMVYGDLLGGKLIALCLKLRFLRKVYD